MEQRSAPRKSAGVGAVVTCRQFGLFRGEIDNLSRNGLYLRTNHVNMCVNAAVTVTVLTEPGDASRCCDFEARVMRQDASGIGMQITSIDPDNQSMLNYMLESLAEDDPYMQGQALYA